MCNKRYYDTLAIIVSIVAGVAFTLLAFFNLLTAGLLTPILGLALGAFSLALLTICAASLLRQNQPINQCLCRKGRRLLIPALWLMIVSAFTLVFALTNLIIGLILAFLLFSLMAYTFFSLYCFLSCMTSSGCDCRD